MEIKYGFQPPTKDDRDKVFGGFNSLPKAILQADRNWALYLPLFERQSGNYETYGCTVFGTLNAFETILKKVYGKDYNFAERYNYNLINLKAPGADPKKAAQSIHEYGVIEQAELPYIDSQQFATPRPMTKEYIEKGHKWLEQFDFRYEWVWEDIHDRRERLKRMKECLQYSPLGISVSAWNQNQNGEYEDKGQPNNHWCLAFRIDDLNRVWAFDTYDQSIKTLSADHSIQYCMRYHITTLKDIEIQLSLIQKVINFFKDILAVKKKDIKDTPLSLNTNMETNEEKLLKVALEALDTEVTPKDEVPDEVACSEVLTTLIKKVFPDFPIIGSTAELFNQLKRDKRFKATLEPKRGCLIVSPRTSTTFGHCGIQITNDGRFASNDSKTGIFKSNYSWESWIEEFIKKRNLRIFIFELL